MRKILIPLIVILSIFFAFPANASSGERHQGISDPVACVVPDAKASKWRIRMALRYWNNAQSHVHFTTRTDVPCSLIKITTYSATSRFSENAGMAVFDRWSEGHFGLNGAWFYPGATILLNQDWFRHLKKFDYKPKCWKTSLVIHELGHVLGLDHVRGETVMDPVHDPERCFSVPSQSELDMLDVIYSNRI